MFKHAAVIIVAAAVAQPLHAQQPSAMKSSIANQPVTIEARGLAPIAGLDLPASCAAQAEARQTAAKPGAARITGGYTAGLCEAEDMARQLMNQKVFAIDLNGTTVGAAINNNPKLAEAVANYLHAARVTERKLQVDRGLAEVATQITLGRDFFALFTR